MALHRDILSGVDIYAFRFFSLFFRSVATNINCARKVSRPSLMAENLYHNYWATLSSIPAEGLADPCQSPSGYQSNTRSSFQFIKS